MKILFIIVLVAAVAFWVGRVMQRGKTPQQPLAIKHDAQAAQRITRLPSKIRIEVDALIRRGDTIHAIKLVKESTDFGLKESRDIVDERARQLGL